MDAEAVRGAPVGRGGLPHRRGAAGAERLIPVSDALQVLVGLLSGIREFGLDPEAETALAAPWEDAVSNLRNTLDAFLTEFEGGDSIRMADLLGHDLPEVLDQFIHMLGSEGK